jgi:hypothetical protein
LAGFRIEGSTSGHVAEVTANNEVNVALTRTNGNAGYAVMMSEHDSGAVTGSVYQDSFDITTDYNIRAGLSTLLENEVFNYGAQNTAKHIYRNTNITAAWAGGFLTTNSGAATTLNSGVSIATYAKYPLYGASDIWFEWTGTFAQGWLATNTTLDMGAFLAGTSTPYAPTDGVFFRANSTGLFAVVNYNGTEQTSGVFKAAYGGADWVPTLNQVYKFGISVNDREIEFWLDDTLMVEMEVPSGTGQPMSCGSLPFAIRHAIGGTAASVAQVFKVATYVISMGDFNTNKLWSHQVCEMGQCGYQGQSGGTMGSTSNLTNSQAIPTATAGSNTATIVTGLGGIGGLTATVPATTDAIATSYLNPDSTTAFTGRKLVINGVKISAINAGATVATTPTTLYWSLGFGHTSIGLNTGENTTTKAPRRVPLGYMTIPVGALPGVGFDKDITVQFAAPIVVNPGEYIASVVKTVIGTATASQFSMFSVMFDAHFV